ncbi:hypothetical protein GEOBRER4_n0062 [Citrifermentans bremense]|uniref:SsuA/THI5-like domain-containing protein n=1 Tax=Citrifermentans bremense TaxID=60035 RepID=A0A6S6LUX9_9BACT|nr:NrtA/SsuA/CpmA family ABC transporter substrate-binding protein [Citrifermentans bremense]BCG45309.1 hypothetical protein GEOBRER4_n0062 [Citrifermentans bremense]
MPTIPMLPRFAVILLILLALVLPHPSRCDAKGNAKPETVVFTYQPLASPGGALAAALKHDRVLREELTRLGVSLQMVPVRDGCEAASYLSSGKAQVATLGDMPFLKAVSSGVPLYAIALIKQNYGAVVGPMGLLPSDLKGKRIANTFGSTGHYVLLKTLSNSGLTESDVTMVPLEVTEMEEALLKGKVDAYAAWAPTPELTLARYPDRFAAIGKHRSLSFAAFSKNLADRRPELPRQMAAALVRCMKWLAKENRALERVAGWNLQDVKSLQPRQASRERRSQAEDLRRELSAIAFTPRMPKGIDAEGGSMAEEFRFLKKVGKIPPTVPWQMCQGAFRLDYVDQVLRNAAKYRIARFDYDQN